MSSFNTGRCLKPEQFLNTEHLLKHAFPYHDQFFMVLIIKDDYLSITTKKGCSAIGISQNIHVCLY